MNFRSQNFMAWLRLVRLPNLFTVPGDAWAGYAVAALLARSGWRVSEMLLIGLALLLAYAGGLIQNDLVDEDEDRKDGRVGRPLAGGDVSRGAAVAGLVLAWLGGVFLAWVAGGAKMVLPFGLLLAMVSLYNVVLKPRSDVLASAGMGACRALSFLLGAWVVGGAHPVSFVLAFWLGVYVVGVTWIARNETVAQVVERLDAMRPTGALAGLFLTALIVNVILGDVFYVLPALLLAFVTLAFCGYLGEVLMNRGQAVSPATVQRTVGMFIRVLLPVQSVLMLFFCRGWGECAMALVPLGVGLPLAVGGARRFYAS
jgi:4-hydroxybenzoate polyprenyltransferase